MSGPFGSSQWMYASGGFYGFPIEQSLRFNDDDTAYLSRTPASAGNRKTFTFSSWVKRGNISGHFHQITAGPDANTVSSLSFSENGQFTNLNDLSFFDYQGGGYTTRLITSAVFRDASAWYHVTCAVDTTQATASDRVKIYVNGSQITSFSTEIYPSQNTDLVLNSTVAHIIGAYTNTRFRHSDGYLAEVNFIDGTALDASSFGEFKSGVWIPKQYSGTYGTNGFRLSFADSGNIGDDTSGNTNDWTANNLAATDVLLDSPTNNFCTLNPLDNYNTGATLSEGNLKWSIGVADGATRSNFVMTSGKWYAEFLPSDYCGVLGIEDAVTDNMTGSPSVWYVSNGNKRISGTFSGYGSSYSDTSGADIIGVALDLDAGEVTFYKNNVSQGAITLPSSNGWAIACGSGSGSRTSILNFGQDSSFAGNKTAQGNTDDNGVGDFFYSPPLGFLALAASNLPNPTIDPAQDDVPSDYFNTVLYTGDGTNSKTVTTNFGFTPDLIWNKNRSNAASHALQSSPVSWRYMSSDTTAAEGSAQIGSVGDNSYLIASGNSIWNASGNTYASWCWKAGNGTSSNTDGSITSTVSVNQKAGFSIVSYTGTGANATVGHGLGVAPDVIIFKNRTDADNWPVYTSMLGYQYDIFLDLTNASRLLDIYYQGNPTSTTFSLKNQNRVNGSGDSHIAYCFAEVEGYSKFNSFVGNGSTDGPFIFCGFRPAWVMIKASSTTGNWFVNDTSRDTYNPTDSRLYPNLSNNESNAVSYDCVSNGFKIRNNWSDMNSSGVTYIFMAFAENPFKYANAR